MPRLFWTAILYLFAHVAHAAVCTDEENQEITDAYSTAAATSACAEYSSVSDLLITIIPPCTATDCISVMQQLADSIPNCTISSASTLSKKDSLLSSLDICAPTPASTASTTNCTDAQAESIIELFLEAAQGACSSESDIAENSIFIAAACNTTCGAALQDLESALPNCVYELANSNSNKKSELASDTSFCEDIPGILISNVLYLEDGAIPKSAWSSTSGLTETSGSGSTSSSSSKETTSSTEGSAVESSQETTASSSQDTATSSSPASASSSESQSTSAASRRMEVSTCIAAFLALLALAMHS